MFKLHAIKEHLRQMKGYIAFGFILFFAGVVAGGTNDGFASFLNGQLAGLESMSSTIDQSSNPTLAMFIIIFLNNAIKSIFIIYLGVFFGLIPIFFLAVNGMVIGYLLHNMAEVHGGAYTFEIIIKGLLPHGIIEIPAIVIASAYGIRFGVLAWKGTGSLLFNRSKLPVVGKDIEYFITRSVPMLVILTVSLLLASVVESTFTVWLLGL